MSSTLHELVELSNTWFSSLPGAVQRDVLVASKNRDLSEGQSLYSRGDPPDGIFCVVQGTVRVSGHSADGQIAVLDFYGPGTWFGEVSALDDLPRAHNVEAYEDTKLMHLRGRNLEALLATHATFARALLRLEALRLRILLVALESYSTQSFEQRLASRLLMLAVTHGIREAGGIRIELHLPQETLAQLIGSTRQRFNQILKDLEAGGLVQQQYGRVVLLDRSKIELLTQS